MATGELRPLMFGELLDRTFSLYRKHFWVFVGIMAVPQVFIVAMTVLFQGFQTTATTSRPRQEEAVGIALGFGIAMMLMVSVYFLVYSVALGATTFAVSEVDLGRTITIRGAYQRMRGRIAGLLKLVFSIIVRMTAWVVTVILSPMALRVLVQYSLAIPALLLEKVDARQARVRSKLLTKGQFNRIFVIGLLMTIVSWVVAMIAQGPFSVAVVMLAAKHSPPPYWLRLLMNISGGVAGAFTAPLMLIALVLLYYDVRVRKEGYDLQLMMAALDQTPAQPGPAAAIPPVPL